MAAPTGNKYAEGNEGGRPPYYDENNPDDVAKVIELCDTFFEYIQGEYKEDEFEYEPGKFETRSTTIRPKQPPTVTGLTLYLGFDCKQTLYNYSKKQVFLDPIKRALTKIEQYHEIAVAYGDKCTGNIFVLKNFGWEDKQGVDHTTNGKDLPSQSTKIVFKKFNDQ